MGLQRVPDGYDPGPWYWRTPLSADPHVGKRGRHVVFIPWDTAQGAEWVTKTNNWNLARPDKFKIVNYSPDVDDHPDLLQVSNDPAGVVYIRGHGNPGFSYIMANYTPPGHDDPMGMVLPIREACQRLIDSGLKSTYTGAIKFYSCHSGTKPTPGELAQTRRRWASEQSNFAQAIEMVREKLLKLPDDAMNAKKRQNMRVEIEKYTETLKKGEPQDKSMARQGADYLRERGFQLCAFYGYLGPLGSTYELDTDDDKSRVHKKVELEGLTNRPPGLDGIVTSRPSVARIRC